ncbi:MAG: TraM recognition domain-containing protein [Clostridia bacterium]|nr:TraM recognition domain-containing protein [Clostridia bacterium]
MKDLFLSNKLNYSQVYELSTCLDFFQSEFQTLDSKVLSIIQSEISRITQIFINDLDVKRTFCPNKENVTFSGFENLRNNIVVLNMNVSEYRNLSKIIAAYLKLDFQSEVLMRLAKKTNISPVAFVCDEYSEYVTENDANFFSESREAKCINVVSTQSYTSLLNAVKEQAAAKVIIQSLVNKIWFRTDDLFTIEEAQKQLGKEDKVKFSRSLSENAKETKYNYILKTFKSENSNISESISTHIEHDFIYDINAFSMKLKTFEAICFITTGREILKPCVVKLSPAHQKHFI